MSKAKITVHDVSSHSTKTIELFETNNTEKLDTELGIQGPHQWIFNGRILSQAFSLFFYGVKDGDHLYLYHQNNGISQKKETKRLSKLTAKKNTLQNILSEERLRIKDVLYQRIEGNCQSNRKLIKAFNNFEIQTETQQTHTTTISEFSAATGPSTANLPLLWQAQPTNN